MRRLHRAQDLVDVTDIAQSAGCDFAVFFSQGLWDWCQLSPRGPGLWTREGGLLCSLCHAIGNARLPTGQVRLKTAGEKIAVEIAWLNGDDATDRVVVSLPHEREVKRFVATFQLPEQATSEAPTAEKQSHVPFYFLCRHCEAKWFAESDRSVCPRCRTNSQSSEQLTPPWWKVNRTNNSSKSAPVNGNG